MSDPILGAPSVRVGELITWGGRAVIYQVTKVNGHMIEAKFYAPMPDHASVTRIAKAAKTFDLTQMDRMAWVNEEGVICCYWTLEEVCSKHLYRKASLLNRMRHMRQGKRHTQLRNPGSRPAADVDREDDLV